MLQHCSRGWRSSRLTQSCNHLESSRLVQDVKKGVEDISHVLGIEGVELEVVVEEVLAGQLRWLGPSPVDGIATAVAPEELGCSDHIRFGMEASKYPHHRGVCRMSN